MRFFYSWLLLVCFVAGQYMIYVHQHKIIASSFNKFNKTYKHTSNQGRTIVQAKCSLCDAMHHISMMLDSHSYAGHSIVTSYFYQVYNYDFISIALVLSAGRAPPVLAFC